MPLFIFANPQIPLHILTYVNKDDKMNPSNKSKEEKKAGSSMKEKWKAVVIWAQKRKIPLLSVAVMLSFAINFIATPTEEEPKEVSYQTFSKMVMNNKVEGVEIDLGSPTFDFTGTNEKTYTTDNPKDEDFKKDLLEAGIKVEEVDAKSSDMMVTVFGGIFQIVLIVVVFKVLMGSVSNSKNMKRTETSTGVPGIDFASVAGNEEAKEEMFFLVDFLKNPEKYQDKGAVLPKGTLLYGPPGTGKTLLAKAIAGEAGVPFISTNGSDFMEMYVGLGAKRVRTLFEDARKKAPCIIFIDEIDSIGGARGQDVHSENIQTINALLNELDGFSGSEGVVVIGATNRIQDLDPALVRPGRFDKHIAINPPDQKDRVAILKVHSENKTLASDVNLQELSKLTIGFAGADLSALLNEATILSVTRGHDEISYADINDAYLKTVMKGHEKKNQADRKKDELELVAWHEAGHALTAKLLAKSEVPKVTITSFTSGAGGVTFITPSGNPLPSKAYMENRVKTLYAGRIAEYLLLGDENQVTSGASSDIEEATKIIHHMIVAYGMSEKFGMLNLDTLGITNHANNLVLEEASVISKKLYEETYNFMVNHRTELKDIAEALLEKESITEEELDNLLL